MIEAINIDPVFRKLGPGITAICQKLPQMVWRCSVPWEATCHANDCNRHARILNRFSHISVWWLIALLICLGLYNLSRSKEAKHTEGDVERMALYRCTPQLPLLAAAPTHNKGSGIAANKYGALVYVFHIV